jgi:uncharacterized protein
MNLQDLERMTGEYGEGWALPHVRRLFKLVERISGTLEYDREAFAYAVYLHDWGAFPRFYRPGVDHALRSKEVAENEILPHTGLTAAQKQVVIEAIETHDYRNMLPVCSSEGLLLREADALDFLGTIGIAREFAWGPNQLKKSLDRILSRRDGIRGRFTLPEAQKIAEQRLERMATILNWIHEESFDEL